MKIGRNDPCPCGSGKKYKKCCYLKKKVTPPVIPDEVIAKIQKFQTQEMQRKQAFGDVRPIIHINHKGYKLVAVGSQIHWNKEDKWKTFPDFLMGYIKTVLGSDWGNKEILKPFEERHQILQWYHTTCMFQQAQTQNENGIYDSIPCGAFSAYLSLSYDLYILRHHQKLQENVIRRLKIKDQFQGARYELFVIATCIRAGYDIVFEDEKDGLQKHPEFIATHKKTEQKIAVEAKSRHREGILGHAGQRKADDEIRLKVGSLINDAIQKTQQYPLVIFVDVNLPPSIAAQMEKRPPNLISRSLDQVQKTKEGKDKFNLIVFTNHPHHYGRDDEPDPKKHVVSVFSQIPDRPAQHPEALFTLNQAALQYGNIPNEFPNN